MAESLLLPPFEQARARAASHPFLCPQWPAVGYRCMCHDRVTGEDIALTREFLSIMLAVQRPSVTTALHMIEGYGFIKTRRGHITIKDRDALIDFADGMYGTPEAEYRRLIGPFG